jgi:hypothetical protein
MVANMADSISIDTNAAQLIARFHKFPPAIQRGMLRGLRGELLVTETRVRQRAGLKWRRGGAGLSGRLTSYARPSEQFGVDAAIGFRRTRGYPYELAQEFGAKAKAGGAMAVPLTPLARALSERGQGPRQFPGVLFLVRKGGRATLCQMLGGTIEAQYALLKSIPPRLRFRQSVIESLPAIGRAIVQGEREAWKDV